MEELKSRGEMPITHKALASIPKSEIRQLELWQAEMRRIGAELCQGNYVRETTARWNGRERSAVKNG
jgi:hypothetical protein